jgi:hypothetical protein
MTTAAGIGTYNQPVAVIVAAASPVLAAAYCWNGSDS